MGHFRRIFLTLVAVLAALPEAGCKRREIEGDSHAECTGRGGAASPAQFP
jgi:hypothetical protein